ncbi:MAG: pyridoxal-phosphate dependent enzyme [Actinomycetales bacterium]|nr:pyridoxal-phosphate dependent enzyme [Actinomycetales bacterium]
MSRRPTARWYPTVKRLLDLTVAVLLLGPTLGVLGVAALGSLAFQGPPVLFTQRRIGRYGRPFMLVKLRTMTMTDGGDGRAYRERHRVTRYGRVLRRLRLDEAPQLLHVLTGAMSLVGPRPLLATHLALVGGGGNRHAVRPGLTCSAQLELAATGYLDRHRQLDLDEEYLLRMSLRTDLAILLRTVTAVLSPRRHPAPPTPRRSGCENPATGSTGAHGTGTGLDRTGPPTPLVTVLTLVDGIERRIRLKLEGANPGGSVKHRTARSLIASLPAARLDEPDATLVESTSGNLGVALAMLARERSVRFVAVVDPTITAELRAALQSFGAEVRQIERAGPDGGYLGARLLAVRALLATSPQIMWTDQYTNPANPLVHYRETGPELLGQAGRGPQALFAAVSTGGTFAGLARFFRETCPWVELVAVDVVGSVAVGGDGPGPRYLSGIGSGRVSSFVTAWHRDLDVHVPEWEAVRWCRALLGATGLRLGASSGAVLAACLRRMAARPDLTDAICVCPDFGDSYLTTVYDDSWVSARGWLARLAGDPGVGVRFLGRVATR